MTATYYRDKVVELLAKMFAMRPKIHNANTEAVQKYLLTVYRRATTLTSSFICTYQDDSLKARFQSYVDAEEQRLREGLETVRYDIDAMDTLTLITGPGRIEKVRKDIVHLTHSFDNIEVRKFLYDSEEGGQRVSREFMSRTSRDNSALMLAAICETLSLGKRSILDDL